MLRDMSNLDGICPSYVTGEMSTGPILNWTRMAYYAFVFNIDMRAKGYLYA